MGLLSLRHPGRNVVWVASALAVSAGVVAMMAFYVSSRAPAPGAMPAGHPAVPGAMSAPQAAMPNAGGNLEGLTERLAARLKSTGASDGQGWLLLARSYVEMRRHADAVPAFARARELLGDRDAQMLADYADAVATAAGRRFDAQSRALIAAALAADPANPKALELDASAAYEAGDYARAASQWEKLMPGLDPQSDHGRVIAANIAESRSRSQAGPSVTR